ncbi:MAG: SUMF1/EgtB/PvdO family nonheme iron enzyme [Bacteroidetes bacterium]|nr:SUMF1/EgtB/PvdO family nonheme iron enzyme [Bacteroidota bacterium]
MKKILLFFGLLGCFRLNANNIVTSVSLSSRDVSAGVNNAANFSNLNFSVRWDNSWRWNSSSGSISYISLLDSGSGYSSAPSVSITGGGGSGATATATISGGKVTGITITAAGSGYTSLPTISFSGGGGSGASAEAYIQSWWDAAWLFVKFQVGERNPIIAGASSSGTTVTVPSTENLRAGMPVRVLSAAATGAFAANSVIVSITNSTQFVVSATPSTALSGAIIECTRIWEHAWLNNSGHSAPTGSTIDVGLLTPGTSFNATTNPGLGVFIYRSTAGSGSNAFLNGTLRWNYGAQGIPDNAIVAVRIFATEMVYVPQGSFSVGSGGTGTETGSFTDGSWSSGATIPYQISSEAALGIDNAAGKLWGTSSSVFSTIGNVAADAEATLAAAFPKGFAALYCLKYEISQGQYRDFLNSLTYVQQASRTAVAPSSAANTAALSSANRNGIVIQSSGNAGAFLPAVYSCNLNSSTPYNNTDDGEWIACNFIHWMDGCAYLDWAGLRPMTELEFEKACRGVKAPVSNEYVWGNTTLTLANNITNPGETGEVTNTTAANAVSINQPNVQGPMRVGTFAGSGTTRPRAGATYYGIMEMDGNVWEPVVTVGNTAGRSFTGVHGNGTLPRDGNADVDFWPGINGNSTDGNANTAYGGTTGVTNAAGSGFRGGSWEDNTTSRMNVSDRGYAAYTYTTRFRNKGFRGVRTAQ